MGSQAWLQHADLGAEATTAAWAPDGMQIALATKEGIRLYDATEAHPSPLWEGAGHADAVTAVAFSPCGTKLATGGADRIAKVWDLTDPANPAEVAVFKGHSGAVRAVSWSPDGATIATGSDDKSVRVWSLATGRELMALRGHGSNIEAVAFSPDGNKLASASWDWSVRVWDVKKRVSMLHIRNHSDWVSVRAECQRGQVGERGLPSRRPPPSGA